ncbi:MAG: hypothetical protein IJI98_11185 [Methanosphaera sp.]|nr:hypothetical protein [Methanobrevibacter sp.]MBQ6754199.1 hypothetical protein [Bacteroidales bacterium]MBR0351359.1 hypothetical protein [Clostridia bacterium]MBR0473243.1 hypothetical protein [Methanosphaera sp.]
MNLITSYTEKYNNEHMGIELYFATIPTKKEREELKENKYKYHATKKCWYKRQPKEEVKEVKKEVKTDIKTIKLETIYNDLVDAMNDDMNVMKFLKLKDKLEQKIREETCYKTTSKTRINAIKRVAAKDEVRPVLTGYGILGDYKCVTDSYHAIMIHEDNMPLKLVTSDNELAKKHGKENCICGTYPNFENIFPNIEEDYEEVKIDLNDMEQFYKLHKKNAKVETYKINNMNVNIIFLKNVIDVLGTDINVYVPKNEYKPIVIINKDNEKGLVLPIKKY